MLNGIADETEGAHLKLARIVHAAIAAKHAHECVRSFGFYVDRRTELLERLREYDEVLSAHPMDFVARRRRQRVVRMLVIINDVLATAEAGRAFAAQWPELRAAAIALQAEIAAAEEHAGA